MLAYASPPSAYSGARPSLKCMRPPQQRRPRREMRYDEKVSFEAQTTSPTRKSDIRKDGFWRYGVIERSQYTDNIIIIPSNANSNPNALE